MNVAITKRAALLFMWSLVTLIPIALFGQVNYHGRFNPEEGMVSNQEKPYRDEICLNGNWQFMPLFSKDTTNSGIPADFNWDATPIRIPSPWNVNGFPGDHSVDFVTFPSYPKKWEDATQAWMKKEFVLPANWAGNRVVLHFEAVAGKAIYYLNGQKVGENFDIFLPYEIDVTNAVKKTGKNILLVKVLAPKLFDKQGKYGRRPYVSGSFWGTYIRGIWQDVYLLEKPVLNISDVFVQPDVANNRLRIDVTVHNQTESSQTFQVGGDIRKWKNLAGNGINEAPVEKNELEGSVELVVPEKRGIKLEPHSKQVIQLSAQVNGQLALWSPLHPNLQGLVLNLLQNGKNIDKKYQRFGWRQFSFDKDTLLLNGKPIHLKGDSWHFMGVPQMSRRYAWAWFTMLHHANSNAVRLHAEPFPKFYLDVADELGICVLDETGIWASDGGPDFASNRYWANCRTQVQHLILRDRNHPAVFGWSVCNETIPVAKNVFHAPDTIVNRLLHEINSWVAIAQALDPTRPWISGDGETGAKTNLPTIVGHYGDKAAMKQWSSQDKPWGIGEQGMAYYGSPRQVAAVNGDRAYVSQEGRMEGLATEAYRLLKQQQSFNASYSSIFNIVWYGLKPLTLGMKDSSRPTRLTDGIFFSNDQQGVPGMQPERVGPYTTTLNPGYDPNLPMYETWPLFDAVKAANATNATDNSKGAAFEHFAIPLDEKQNQENDHQQKAVPVKVYFLSPSTSSLYTTLQALGLHFDQQQAQGVIANNSLVIVDGRYPPHGKDSLGFLKRVVSKGGQIFIVGVSPRSLQQLNKLLPVKLALTNRKASSLIKLANAPLLSGLGNADFYFTELLKKPIMTHGLAGSFTTGGKTLLSACNTDWAAWNGRPEYDKTASVLKSERMKKEGGATLVAYPINGAVYYCSSLEIDSMEGNAGRILTQMLSNLGARFGGNGGTIQTALSADGYLHNALFCGAFDTRKLSFDQAVQKDFLGDEAKIQPQIGQQSNHHLWASAISEGNTHTFDLEKLRQGGPGNNAVGYLSFWVYSPRSLVNLLVEPDMPSLDMLISADDAAGILLNGQVLLKQTPLNSKDYLIKNLPLLKGWNHFLIKSVQREGKWSLSARFKSDNSSFMQKIQSAIAQ